MSAVSFFLFHVLLAAVDPRRCYNNTASLHIYNAFYRDDGNNHVILVYKHVHILVYKHVHIFVYEHVHIDVYKHDHYFM
ncbi:hypothetical protein WR25_16170 [Diploscapter pachys]|uniref:Secreted protein n=1 Tax=Diploscapter pachys TaxID=2018661 RepID=A0A2A2KTY9_9BILA|nr:hypothetical protein WR25_16170 [Diploscapter pachys]